jgi:zinc-binding alcohol dehydrogenase family protein
MADMMRAVGYRKSLPISNSASLEDIELPVPTPGPHDLLVRMEAVSVNPADVKARAGSDPAGQIRVLGYDGAGVVAAVGAEVKWFQPGDEVFYSGSIGRPGTNAQLHLVNEHVVGHKPTSLTFAQAAAMPLTSITAWESLFDRFGLTASSDGTLLVVGAAGGVGSMVVQLARARTKVTIIGTASGAEQTAWVTDLGADHVVDHRRGLADAVLAAVPDGVDYIMSPFSGRNIAAYARILRPGGHVTAIDEPEGMDILPLKEKSITWHWELMFTKPLFQPDDPSQHQLLEQVASLVDDGKLRTTIAAELSPFSAATMREAHAQMEGSGNKGKVVVTGF